MFITRPNDSLWNHQYIDQWSTYSIDCQFLAPLKQISRQILLTPSLQYIALVAIALTVSEISTFEIFTNSYQPLTPFQRLRILAKVKTLNMLIERLPDILIADDNSHMFALSFTISEIFTVKICMTLTFKWVNVKCKYANWMLKHDSIYWLQQYIYHICHLLRNYHILIPNDIDLTI